jgi:hypothetical protein
VVTDTPWIDTRGAWPTQGWGQRQIALSFLNATLSFLARYGSRGGELTPLKAHTPCRVRRPVKHDCKKRRQGRPCRLCCRCGLPLGLAASAPLIIRNRGGVAAFLPGSIRHRWDAFNKMLAGSGHVGGVRWCKPSRQKRAQTHFQTTAATP